MTPPLSSTLTAAPSPLAGGAPDLTRPLAAAIDVALDAAVRRGSAALDVLRGAEAVDRRDRFLVLLTLYDLHTAPVDEVGPRVRFQGSPVLADIKERLETAWLAELERDWQSAGQLSEADTVERVVSAMRAVAAKDRLPATYRWLAKEASWQELVDFLALEGGPDGGFDDLVAVCQVGLDGAPKMELARNYWDEMGNGVPAAVHRRLHDELVAALGMTRVPVGEQPVAALERAALGGLLATNRWLLPEMVGALGLIELQAGPRCRLVLQALERVGVPRGALPFYEVHAEVDPRHGKDWLDNVVAPLTADDPAWAPGIVRGAAWRHTVDQGFLDAAADRFGAW